MLYEVITRSDDPAAGGALHPGGARHRLLLAQEVELETVLFVSSWEEISYNFV